MFLIHNVKRNICCNKMKNIVNLCICIMVMLLLNIYIGSLTTNQQQLTNLSNVLPVSAQITNLNGSQNVGLEISKDIIEGIRKSPYVKNTVFSMQLAGAQGVFPKEEWKRHLNLSLQAVNSIEGIFGLELENIQLDKGISEDFLESGKPYILVDEKVLDKNKWKIGEKVQLSIYYYVSGKYGQFEWDFLTTQDFYIAGTMKILDISDSISTMDGVVSFKWAENIFEKNNMTYVGDSVSFELKNPERLNDFKAEMKELKLMEVVTAANPDLAGNTLVVKDGDYIKAATRLRENRALLKNFIPLILLIVLGVGYTISYLMMQSRKNEWVLMRLLGMSKGCCIAQFFLEILSVEVLGGVLGVVVSSIFQPIKAEMVIGTFGVFLFCYICGTLVALERMSSTSVMRALVQQE